MRSFAYDRNNSKITGIRRIDLAGRLAIKFLGSPLTSQIFLVKGRVPVSEYSLNG